MKKTIFFALIAAFSLSVNAAPKKPMTGKCAQSASDAVIAKWANVPNPSESLEYDVVYSHVNVKDHSSYEVRWGDFDGNQGLIYLSKLKMTADCKLDGEIQTETIGSVDVP